MRPYIIKTPRASEGKSARHTTPSRQALSIPCLVNGNFHGELLFKTVGPLAMGVIIASTGALKRLRSTITGRTESSSRLIRSQILLALTYFVLIPATNAVLRAFPCEVRVCPKSRGVEGHMNVTGRAVTHVVQLRACLLVSLHLLPQGMLPACAVALASECPRGD